MTDPRPSKYDPAPIDPKQEGGNEDPPDLGNTQAPELKVVWDKHPSYNLDPKKTDDGGGAGDDPPGPVTDAFKINLKSVGGSVESMLATSRVAVTEYEDLKAKVMAQKDNVFGQNSTIKEVQVIASGAGGYGTTSRSITVPTEFSGPAKDFADRMNPVQEKALQQIGATLELVGEYIALVNRSGQVYAQSDRHSRFPDPPASK